MKDNHRLKTSQVLNLTEDLFYGNGRHKKCYVHPDNENLCIKIAYNRGGRIDLLREINYIKILKKRNATPKKSK